MNRAAAVTDGRGLTSSGPCGSYPERATEIAPPRQRRPGGGRKSGRVPGSVRDLRERRELATVRLIDVDRWYCVVAQAGERQEADKAIRLCERSDGSAGFELFAPMVWFPAVPRRRMPDESIRPARDARLVPMFGRFMFARFSLGDPDWHRIKQLDGVRGIMGSIGAPATPAAIPDGAIDEIRKLPRMASNGCRYPAGAFKTGYEDEPIEAGSIARLLSGSLADVEATCEWSDTRRVRLWLPLFGGAPATVARRDVAAVE